MNLADVICGLVILFVLAIMIAPAIIDLIIEIKCFNLYMKYRFFGGSCWGMRGCGKDNCCLRHFCPMYQHSITPEVLEELDDLLQKRCKELEIADEE